MTSKKRQPHPRALPYLFLTELWERYGFYTVQGLLVLYMTEYFNLPDSESYSILGVFTALAYISPLAGGYLASHVLGYKTSIIWGGFFLIVGYGLLALPFTSTLLYPSLATIVVGTGLFKPNISSLLGTQYSFDDPRRDSGFTIFYIGINSGILLAGLSSGYVKDYFGWRVSFALASIGLIIGLLTFCYGIRYLKAYPHMHNPNSKTKRRLLAYSILALLGLNFLLRINALANWLLPAIGIVLLVYLTILTMRQDAEYRKRMFILNVLIVSSIVFWMLYLQMFYSANLYIERLIDKSLFGIPLSTPVFYASQSIFVILLGPLFAWIWDHLAHADKNPSPVSKFIFAIVCAGIACLILGISTMVQDAHALVNPFWIFSAYFMFSVGELLLSPVGLSAVTWLAPPHLAGVMMGVWFVALGFGGIFAGWIAKLSSLPEHVLLTTTDKLAIYQGAFLNYAYLAFFVAIFLFFMQASLRRLLR
jgi:POT family proton-dependent oligopeptide transporter